MLYNLKPNTTSRWKNIKVCKERCDNFAYADKILILFTIFILLLWLIIFKIILIQHLQSSSYFFSVFYY